MRLWAGAALAWAALQVLACSPLCVAACDGCHARRLSHAAHDDPPSATDTASHALRLAHSRDELPEAATLSIVLCVSVHPATPWRATLLTYMRMLRKQGLQREARAYEVVLCGGDDAANAEAGAIVRAACHTCIIHTTDHSVQVASVDAIGRHGSGGLADDEVDKHVVLYVGHEAATPGNGSRTVDGVSIFNDVAGSWASTLPAFNHNANLQLAGCGFDALGRPLLNQWLVRASYVRKLVHPMVYFPNAYAHNLCGTGCVNDWMVTIDKQYRLDLGPGARRTLCGEGVIASAVA